MKRYDLEQGWYGESAEMIEHEHGDYVRVDDLEFEALRARVADLESLQGDIKTASDVLQEYEGATIWQQAQSAVARIAELEAEQESMSRTLALADEALAESDARDKQSEPVAWVHLDLWQAGNHWPDDCFSFTAETGMTALYTAQPRREWVGLTDDEILEVLGTGKAAFLMVARAIEAALKEKNT